MKWLDIILGSSTTESTLDVLERRLLMYADLDVLDVQLSSNNGWFVPGEKVSATVIMQNVGYSTFSGTADVFVGGDPYGYGASVAFGVKYGVSVRLAPGAVGKVTVPFTIPMAFSPGYYDLYGSVDTSDAYGYQTELYTYNNYLATDRSFELAYRFGSYDGRSNVKLNLIDPARAEKLTVSLSGPGYGELIPGSRVDVWDTQATSAFSIAVTGGSREWTTSTNAIYEVHGSLKSFKAPGLSFSPDSMLLFNQPVSEIHVGDLRDTSIVVESTTPVGVKITARDVYGSDLFVDGRISAFAARNVFETPYSSEISARSIGLLTATGNFDCDVETTDSISFGLTTKISVKHAAAGEWRILNDVSSISIGSAVSGEFVLKVRGAVKAFTSNNSLEFTSLSAWSFGSITVKGNVTQSVIGSGSYDTGSIVEYGVGSRYGAIGALTISGNVDRSFFISGYSDGMPVTSQSSAIPKISIKGYIDYLSEFTASVLPATVRTMGGVITTSTDPRFRLDL